MRPWLLCLRDRTTIITIEVYRTGAARDHVQLRNKLSDPYNFFRGFRSRDVLGFYYRIGHRLLLGTLPTHYSTIKGYDKVILRLAIVLVSLEASIGETTYNELFRTSID